MPAKNIVKIYQPQSYYHLYNRGVNKEEIFLDYKDYKTFLGYLKFYLTLPNLQGSTLKVSPSRNLKNYFQKLKLLAYCLMPNHFHLMVYQEEADGINFFMRSLATKYSMYFNRVHQRVGHVFQGIYKAVNITSEEQFLYLSKYIHRNPIEILPIGINLEGYQYSSYGNYLRVFYQSWVEPEEILSYFSRRKYDNSYKEFVDEFEERDAFKVKDIVIEDDLQGWTLKVS